MDLGRLARKETVRMSTEHDCPVCGLEGIWWEGDHDTPGFYTCPDWTCMASKVPEPEPAEDENE